MNSGASDSSKKSCANLSLPFCFLLMFFSTLYVMNGSQPYLQLQSCALQYGVATSILIWSLYRFSCFDLDKNNIVVCVYHEAGFKAKKNEKCRIIGKTKRILFTPVFPSRTCWYFSNSYVSYIAKTEKLKYIKICKTRITLHNVLMQVLMMTLGSFTSVMIVNSLAKLPARVSNQVRRESYPVKKNEEGIQYQCAAA